MKLKDILNKIAKGEAISDAEKQFLTTYQEPKQDTSETDTLRQERDDLQSRLDEAEGKGKTELEKAQTELKKTLGKLTTAEKERDEAKAGRAALEYDNAVSALAAEHKFSDRDFLKYKFQSGKIDPSDPGAAKTFMENLKKETPKFFSAEVNQGGGGGDGNNSNGGNSQVDPKVEWTELMKKDHITPTEAARRMELAEQLRSSQSSQSQNSN